MRTRISSRLRAIWQNPTALFSAGTIPFALLMTCVLAYGLLIPWLGFYWDDWPTLWFLNRFGPTVFKSAYGTDRPALGWLFTTTTTLVGQSPIAWQIFALLMRWVACLSLWAMLRAIWPKRVLETAWVAFLFAIYPGFQQQPIAFTYSADWIAISLFFLSFWLMIKATRLSNTPTVNRSSYLLQLLMMIASWLLAAYVMFADEYYFGLELLRPVFLWLVLSEVSEKKAGIPIRSWRFWQVIFRWLPYLVIMVVFLYWRLVVFVSPRGQVEIFDQLASQPFAAGLSLAIQVFADLTQSSINSWLQTLKIKEIFQSLHSPWLMVAYSSLVVIATGFLIYYFIKVQRSSENLRPPSSSAAGINERKAWAVQAVSIGFIALLIGGLPFWVTNLPIELYFPWDRFNLAMMFGASLALAGVVVLLARTSLQKAIIFGLLGGLAIGFHLYNSNLYRVDWNQQRAFFWQLTWRAPTFRPGTLLLTQDLPFKYYSDNSLTAPLNLTYAPRDYSLKLPYMFYNIESRLGLGLAALETDLPIQQKYRIASFDGNTSNMVVLFYDPPRCLKVLDPNIDLLLPRKPGNLDAATPLSNLDMIEDNDSNPAQPPDQFFGSEPAHDWCYYFQKADLARQQENWPEVARLGDLALPAPILRNNSPELIPFIQGYAHVGQWDKAVQLTKQAFEAEPKIANMLCPIWYDLQPVKLPEAQNAIQKVRETLSCEF